jgi:hypothetical protein
MQPWRFIQHVRKIAGEPAGLVRVLPPAANTKKSASANQFLQIRETKTRACDSLREDHYTPE